MKRIKSFEPPKNKYGLILTINKEVDKYFCNGLLEKKENIYSRHPVLYAYTGMPTYIYLTTSKGIVGRAIVGSDEDFKRIQKEYNYTDKQIDKGIPLINFVHPGVIEMYQLIEFGIFKKVPVVSKYINKSDNEIMECFFESLV